MIGIDLVYIPEFKRQLSLGKETFLLKTFTKTELKNQQIEHLAGIWAAKEAIIKACGLINSELLKIEIKYRKNGQPFACVNTKIIELSIAHHGEYAVAIAKEA